MSKDPKYGDEPSMAEILASVRRIVAEDGKPTIEQPPEITEAEPKPEQEPEPSRQSAVSNEQPEAGKKANILQQLLARQETAKPSEEVDVLELVNPVSQGEISLSEPEPMPAAETDISDERLVAAFDTWANGAGEENLRTLVREELKSVLGAALSKS